MGEKRQEAPRPEVPRDGPGLVVVGVDGSSTSWNAAAYAGGLVRRQGGRLVVVHVVGTSSAASGFLPGLADTLVESGRQTAEYLEQQMREGARISGVRIDFSVRFGDVYAELTKAADELAADHVVVGASESAGHRWVGSLAVRLVRAGRWPITVVP